MSLLTPRVVVSGPVARVTEESVTLDAVLVAQSCDSAAKSHYSRRRRQLGWCFERAAERSHVVCECVLIRRREVGRIKSETVTLSSPNGDQQLKSQQHLGQITGLMIVRLWRWPDAILCSVAWVFETHESQVEHATADFTSILGVSAHTDR